MIIRIMIVEVFKREDEQVKCAMNIKINQNKINNK